MIKSFVCASLIAASALSAQPAWVSMMSSGDATRYTYPNSTTPRAACTLCGPEQADGVSATGPIEWPGASCPDADDPVNPKSYYCESSLRQSANNDYPPGPALWWTSLNPDGSHASDLTGAPLSRPTSVTYRNTTPTRMTGFYVAANISSSGAGTKNMYLNLTDNYSGGPEFGFVFDPADPYNPMYFYWSTNANCGGNPELGVHSLCTDAPCKSGYVPQLGEPQCSNAVNDVFENGYADPTGGTHQVDSHSHSLALLAAYDRDLVYVAYLRQMPGGEIWFHVEVDTPDGGIFRGERWDFNPNSMGFGDWYPTEALYQAGTPGYVTITVQPGVPQPCGTALTVTQVSYMSAGAAQ